MNKKILITLIAIGIAFFCTLIILSFLFISVEIKSYPSDAKITIDNKKTYSLPLKKYLRTGKHQIEIQKEDYKTIGKEILIEKGKDAFSFTLISLREEFISKLPIYADSWDVDYIPEIDSFSIIVTADPLEENKASAMEWLKDQGINPEKDAIIWDASAVVKDKPGP